MAAGSFSSAYMEAKDLRRQVVREPATVGFEHADHLASCLADRTHYPQSNARFLYLEMARALAELAVLSPDNRLRAHCLDVLEHTVTHGNDKAVLAAGEALGSLPLALAAEDVPAPAHGSTPVRTWDEVVAEAGVKPLTPPLFVGRTLVAGLDGGGSLAVKLARQGQESATALHREAAWMDRLADQGLPRRFKLPRPVRPAGRTVFKLSRASCAHTPKGLGRDCLAMAFTAPPGYYHYPNDVRPGRLPKPAAFVEMMDLNAGLLGALAARGVIHTATVPLFHNRIQGGRRPDQGIYEWRRLGRLDRWLESSLYPNFGASGLRDFEHFEAVDLGPTSGNGNGRGNGHGKGHVLGPPDTAYKIGDHALGLLLVAGSHFRAKNPGLRGLDEHNEPVDARRLFDHELLAKAIRTVFTAYVRGFTGLENGGCPLDADALAGRMVEELGVDRHMEEVIRARDQAAMPRERFRNLLVAGGFSPVQADGVHRGHADVTIVTGPHLGGFNSQTTLPELSLFAAAVAGLSVSRRYRDQAGLAQATRNPA